MASTKRADNNAPESYSEMQQNPYGKKLSQLGLQSKRVERESNPPDQFQIAQLAATLCKNSEEKRSYTDLAGEALQLWSAAGRVLWVKDQLKIVCRGLLHFDRGDWWTHAGDLAKAFDDTEGSVPGQSETDMVEAFEVAGRKAGQAISEMWWRGWYCDNDSVLSALFPGRAESGPSRASKFLGLVSYINKHLENENVQKSDYFKKYNTDALTEWIEGSWCPLGFGSDHAKNHLLKVAKEKLASPEKFLQPAALSVFPELIRFFVVMRLLQNKEMKTRRK